MTLSKIYGIKPSIRIVLVLLLTQALTVLQAQQDTERFDRKQDLLLAHFDCKTDVDDLHSAAAFASLMHSEKSNGIRYHAVAGAYGMQNGLYVPPETLFEMAFGENWSDAHGQYEEALRTTAQLSLATLDAGGKIWIADAGQSDFSADLIRELKRVRPDLSTPARIHVVQHSTWNEDVTTPEDLAFVKSEATYHKIPDGNVVGNGSPGFQTEETIRPANYLDQPELVAIWDTALELANQYNGADNRHYNKAIAVGGLDFSDLSETCWILGLGDLKDTRSFFQYLSN